MQHLWQRGPCTAYLAFNCIFLSCVPCSAVLLHVILHTNPSFWRNSLTSLVFHFSIVLSSQALPQATEISTLAQLSTSTWLLNSRGHDGATLESQHLGNRDRQIFEFKVSLVYIASSRPSRTTVRPCTPPAKKGSIFMGLSHESHQPHTGLIHTVMNIVCTPRAGTDSELIKDLNSRQPESGSQMLRLRGVGPSKFIRDPHKISQITTASLS